MKVRSHLALMIAIVLVPVVLVLGHAIPTLLESERDAYLRSMREAARSTSLASDREWTYAAGSASALSHSRLLAAGDFAGFYRQCQKTAAFVRSPSPVEYAGARLIVRCPLSDRVESDFAKLACSRNAVP